jgi:hypothetical protein
MGGALRFGDYLDAGLLPILLGKKKTSRSLVDEKFAAWIYNTMQSFDVAGHDLRELVTYIIKYAPKDYVPPTGSRRGHGGHRSSRSRMTSRARYHDGLKNGSECNWKGLFPPDVCWILQQWDMSPKRATKWINTMRDILLDGGATIWGLRCREANEGEIPDSEFTAHLRIRGLLSSGGLPRAKILHRSESTGQSHASRSEQSTPID